MRKRLGSLRKFGLGMIGAVSPLVARYYLQETTGKELVGSGPGGLPGFVLSTIFMVIIGGVVAYIMTEKEREPWKVFVAGVTAPALILSLASPALSQPRDELYRNPTTLGVVVADEVRVLSGYPGMVEGERAELIRIVRWNNIMPVVESYELAEEDSCWYKVLFARRPGVFTEGWVLGKRRDEVYLSAGERGQPEFDDLLFRFNIRAAPPHPDTPINASEKSFFQQLIDGVRVSLGGRGELWFVIAGSHRTYEDAQRQVRLIDVAGLRNRGIDVNPEIYEYIDASGYAVALGRYLTEPKAILLRDRAIEFGFPRDTYLWALKYSQK